MSIEVTQLICDNCSETNNLMQLDTNEIFCQDCFNEQYFYCEECEGVHAIGDAKNDTTGNLICQTCFDNNYFCCEGCGEVHKKEDSYTGADDELYCSDCFYDTFTYCDSCGEIIYTDDAFYTDDGCYCSYCYDNQHNNNNEYIDSYHANKGRSLIYYRGRNEKRKPLYFGVEIEALNKSGNNHDEVIDEILNSLPDRYNYKNYIYFEEDSSLELDGYEGFETITNPCTFNYLHTTNNFVENTFTSLQSEGMRAFNSACGQHVHVSKRAYKTLEIYKLFRFFAINGQAIHDTISQRKDKHNYYCDYLNENKYDCQIIAKNKFTTGRKAICLTSSTIEFRLFQGNLLYKRFLKNIEFITELKIFLASVPVTKIDTTFFNDFIKYLEENKNSSNRNLTNFLSITKEAKELNEREVNQCV